MKPKVHVSQTGRVEIERRGLDEVVIEMFAMRKEGIGGPQVIHLERMGPRDWFLGIGDSILNIQTLPGGKLKVTVTEL